MAPELGSVDARNKLEDLSGLVLKPGENPYAAFIDACHDDPVSFTARSKRAHPQWDKIGC